MAMLRGESGGGKKNYPVGSPEWIQEQKRLADQRNLQEMLEKQKYITPRPTGHLEPEEIPLPSGDTATQNPVDITPIPRSTGQLRPEEIPLPSGNTATQNPVIDPSLYPGIDLLSNEQLHSLLTYTGQMPDESDEIPRDELQNILLNWKHMQLPGKVSTRGYDIEMRGNKYAVTNGDTTTLFPFAEDAINYVYGTSAINNNNGDLLTRYFRGIADNMDNNLKKLAAGEEEQKKEVKKSNEEKRLNAYEQEPQPGPPPDYIPEPMPTPNSEAIPTPTPEPTPTTTRGGEPVQSTEKISVEVYVNQPWVQKVLNDDSNKEFIYINSDWSIVDKEDSNSQIDLIKQSRNQLWEEEQQAWNSIYDIVSEMGNIIKEKYDQVIFGKDNEFSSFQEFMEYVSAVWDIYSGVTTFDGYSLSSGLDSLWNLEGGPEFLSDLKKQAEKIQDKWNTIQLYEDFIRHYNNRIGNPHHTR